MLPSSGAIAAREMQITRKKKSDKMIEVYEKEDCSDEVNFLLGESGDVVTLSKQAKEKVDKERKEKRGGKGKTRGIKLENYTQ